MSTETHPLTDYSSSVATPWTVIVHNDPVNLVDYVIWVFCKVFGYDQEHAGALTMEIHHHQRSVVWTGEREKAEFFAAQLQEFQLTASLERQS